MVSASYLRFELFVLVVSDTSVWQKKLLLVLLGVVGDMVGMCFCHKVALVWKNRVELT